MPLVAGVDAAASSLLSPLQWSCLPSPYAPRRREDGEQDGAKEGAWRSSLASAVAGVVYWRTPVLCRWTSQGAAVGEQVGEKSDMGIQKKRTSRVHLLMGPIVGSFKKKDRGNLSPVPSCCLTTIRVGSFFLHSRLHESSPASPVHLYHCRLHSESIQDSKINIPTTPPH